MREIHIMLEVDCNMKIDQLFLSLLVCYSKIYRLHVYLHRLWSCFHHTEIILLFCSNQIKRDYGVYPTTRRKKILSNSLMSDLFNKEIKVCQYYIRKHYTHADKKSTLLVRFSPLTDFFIRYPPTALNFHTLYNIE